jgi:hypothetical protein
MGFQNYITEIEASSFTGVSIATLNRFAEAGYFQIEIDPDGLRLFSKGELAQVFGIMNEAPAEEKPKVPEAPRTAAAEAPPPKPQHVPERPAATTVAAETPPVARTAEQSAAVQPTPTTVQPPQPPPMQPVAQPAPARGLSFLEQEATRLKNLVGLHEKLLELREGEIRDLKQEREWLKLRIEKLENQSDRNQLLLLSEIQMATRIMRYQAEKKSKIRGMLEWLGIVAPSGLPAPAALGAPVEVHPPEDKVEPEFKRAA